MTTKLAGKPAPRETWTAQLLRDVRFFHAATGMKFESIGGYAIKNRRFWQRMVDGGTVTLEKADEIYAWMASQGYHFNQEGDCYVEGKE